MSLIQATPRGSAKALHGSQQCLPTQTLKGQHRTCYSEFHISKCQTSGAPNVPPNHKHSAAGRGDRAAAALAFIGTAISHGVRAIFRRGRLTMRYLFRIKKYQVAFLSTIVCQTPFSVKPRIHLQLDTRRALDGWHDSQDRAARSLPANCKQKQTTAAGPRLRSGDSPGPRAACARDPARWEPGLRTAGRAGARVAIPRGRVREAAGAARGAPRVWLVSFPKAWHPRARHPHARRRPPCV